MTLSLRSVSAALLTVLAFPSAALAASSGPAGYVVDESDCGSGGPSTYFFADGVVFRADCGDDCPNLRVGTWKQTDTDMLTLKFTRAFLGKGDNPEAGPTPARTMYKDYTAKVDKVDAAEPFAWSGPETEDGDCTVIRKHGLTSDPHAFLRKGFIGRWPFTSERPLTDADLAGLGKDDLEIMRNEIYARYGHIFVSKRLAKHFTADPDYRPYFKNVSAFLSPLERDNVAKIQAAEKAQKK